jgi:hypothetical protein
MIDNGLQAKSETGDYGDYLAKSAQKSGKFI